MDCENSKEVESAETILLNLSRHGNTEEIEKLLLQSTNVDINHIGKTKPNKSWSSLHLASYFGHTDTVDLLLRNSADSDITNSTGDSPLHKAAFTNRLETVKILVQSGASCLTTNNNGKLPSQLATNEQIIYFLQASENMEKNRISENFLQLIKEENIKEVKLMLKKHGSIIDLLISDLAGNNCLHHSVLRNNVNISILLLEAGINPNIQNNQGVSALDMCESTQLRKLLQVQRKYDHFKEARRFEGPLLKKKRFTGTKFQWAVLERGIFSFFWKRADAVMRQKRISFKYLNEAKVTKLPDSNGFIVEYFDGSRHVLSVKDSKDAMYEREKWIKVIMEHSVYSDKFVEANKLVESDSDEDFFDDITIDNMLLNANAHNEVMKKNLEEIKPLLHNVISPCEDNDFSYNNRNRQLMQISSKFEDLLKTSQQLFEVYSSCHQCFNIKNKKIEQKVTEEREKNNILQKSIQALATENHLLENQVDISQTCSAEKLSEMSSNKNVQESVCNSDDDEEFYDAVQADESASSDLTSQANEFSHRSELPCTSFSRDSISLWHILKQSIGKELSRITMPVVFNEPLSFIQRLCEYMDYTNLLQQASSKQDSINRLEMVSTFAIAALASQYERLGKPFNPLLGETYEYKRSDLGFHWVSEQVSHHPPISAFCAIGTHPEHPFEFRGSCDPKIRFGGRKVEIEPKGHVYLDLKKHSESYHWTNPPLSVNNIIVGKLWMEQHGTITIHKINCKEKCDVTFKSYSWLKNNSLNKIEATIYNEKGEKTRVLVGDWTKFIYSMDIPTYKTYQQKTSKKQSETLSMIDALELLSTESNCKLLWKVIERPKCSEQMYCMTKLAMQLNQSEVDGYQIPQTDSRYRPDIRKLENADIDAAAEEKNRLETKQRNAKKIRTKSKTEWTPRWFVKTKNSETKTEDWKFKPDQYFSRDWTKCPDIF